MQNSTHIISTGLNKGLTVKKYSHSLLAYPNNFFDKLKKINTHISETWE